MHAGLAVGAFYSHFQSKRDLLVELMQALVDHMSRVDLRPPVRTSRQLALRAHFQDLFRGDDHSHAIVRAWQEAALTDSAIAAMDATIVQWTERSILRLLEHLLTWPNARTGHDIAGFAFFLNASMWTLLARSSNLPRDEFARQIGTVADVLYHYLFRDRRSSVAAGD